MYYLEQKQFMPSMILFGILFIPLIIGLLFATILSFDIAKLIILFVFLVLYILTILYFWKESRIKDFYLLLKNGGVEIVFFDCMEKGKVKLDLSSEQLLKIEYYRIISIIGWLTIPQSLIFPKCVFITYNIDGEIKEKFIGYMNTKDVKKVSKITNTELKIH